MLQLVYLDIFNGQEDSAQVKIIAVIISLWLEWMETDLSRVAKALGLPDEDVGRRKNI